LGFIEKPKVIEQATACSQRGEGVLSTFAFRFLRREEMKTFICPGYEGHPCGQITEHTNRRQKRCRACTIEAKKTMES
jgi:hypothetical protein